MRCLTGLLRLGVVLGGMSLFQTRSAGASLAPEADLGKSAPHFAKVGTNQVHYLQIGTGSATLVFIHGWSCNVDFWRFQVPALEEKVRLILIDLPGHGRSDKPKTAYTMAFFAQAIDAVLQHAHVDRAVLAGHSMGTPVICRFHRDYPAKTQALVAVDGPLRGWDATPEQAEAFLGRFRGPDYRAGMEEFIDSMFPFPGAEALRDRAKQAMVQTPQHVVISALEGILDRAAWEPQQIDVPLLVLNAPNPNWTADYETHVRKIAPRVEYHTIAGAGHFLMQEKPEESNRLLIEFLRRHSRLAQ